MLCLATIPSGGKMCPGSDVHGRLEEIPWPERSCSLTEEPSENAEMRSVPDRRTHLALVFFSLPLRIDRTADLGSQVVAMMQAAESWLGLNSASRIGVLPRFTIGGRSLRQRKMCPVVVVVADVILHESFQMPRVEYDHVVEQVPTTVAKPTIRNAVLPGLQKLVRFGSMLKHFNVSNTLPLKFAPRSKIR